MLAIFVAVAADQIIGLTVLETAIDPRRYTDQFDVEEFIQLNYHDIKTKPVMLRYFIMNPLFQPRARYVIEEMFRIEGFTTLIYPVDPSNPKGEETDAIANRELVAVKRRGTIQYPNNTRDGQAVGELLPLNLMFLASNMLYEHKVIVNTRIVVLGSSMVGLTFLEKLIYVSVFLYLLLLNVMSW